MLARNSQLVIAVLFLLLVSFSVAAIESARLQFGSLQYADIDLSQLDITFSLNKNGLAMQATADKFTLANQQFIKVALNCQQFKIAAKFWQCRQGQLSFTHTTLGKQKFKLSFTANTHTNDYQLDLDPLMIANGKLQVNLHLSDDKWQTTLKSQHLDASALITLLTQLLPDRNFSTIKDWQPQGAISGTADLSGSGTQLNMADIQLTSADFGFSDESGNHVGETLDIALAIKAVYQQDWQWQAKVAVNNGQSYWTPVFLDFQQTPVQLSLKALFQPENQRWQLKDIKFQQQDVLSATGAVQLEQKHLQKVEMTVQSSPMSAIYKWWLQPFATGSAVANVSASGQIAGKLDWQPEKLQFDVDLQQLTISDNAGRFAIDGLDGQFAWTTRQSKVPVNLRWQQINFGSLPIGASSLQAEVANSQLALTEELNLPLLDGGLQISSFNYQYAAAGSHWQFEGLLKPLSMQALTHALGWPEMDGKLSGVIPRVSYQNQQIDIDGALQVKVFDGTAIIKDLQLQSPFGSLPQLRANIDIQQIDLEHLTRTFDFGKISGRLDGSISGLRLSDWQPVQFDARFATSENNPGKRLISQRAVDNLSQIGGGASSIMSRSFLRFFEDFSYNKLGIRCQLNNEVCHMSGIEEDEQGYYIVKGGGLPPWINVIGYTRRVDWPDLLARLQAVKNSDGPIIK